MRSRLTGVRPRPVLLWVRSQSPAAQNRQCDRVQGLGILARHIYIESQAGRRYYIPARWGKYQQVIVSPSVAPDLSREVARALVVHLCGGRPVAVHPTLQVSPARTPALRRILVFLLQVAGPSVNRSLACLADHLNLSARHLTRLFREELLMTPVPYLESIRVDILNALSDQGFTAAQARPAPVSTLLKPVQGLVRAARQHLPPFSGACERH